MKNIKLFQTKKEYENYVFDQLIKDPLLAQDGFYKNLIQFVIDTKTPIFYEQSDESEYANFSAYYNFILIRDNYANDTMRGMYFLHDLTHLVFYYPYDISSVNQAEFDEAIILNEYTASNETEVFVHYRIPELRQKILQDRRIFFDVLKARAIPKPTPRSLLFLRKALIETDDLDTYFFTDSAYQIIKKQYKSYRGNRAWCKARFIEIRKFKNPTEYFYPFLTTNNYERVLSNYISTTTEQDYQKNILKNFRLAFELMGIDDLPESFEDCFKKVELLEDKILVKTIIPKE